MTDLATLEVTDAQLAALFGCTARYIRKFCEQGKLVRVGRNTYHLGPAIQVLVEELGGGSDLAKKLMAERIRKVAADADRAELEFAKAKGEVALLAEIQKAWELQAAIIRTNILNVPARAVLQLLGETDEATFKQCLRAELVLALTQAAEAEITPDDFVEDEPQNDDESE